MYIVCFCTKLQFLTTFFFFFLLIKVTCGRCNKSMKFKEYEDTHSATHYNLCWKIGDEQLVSNFFLTIVYTFYTM